MINKKGFSLVELMAVLVILGVVFAIAIPSYNSYTKKARNTLYSSYISNIKDATSAYLEECLRNNTCSKLNDNDNYNYTYYTIRGHRIRNIDPNNLNVKIDNNKCSDAKISIGFPTTTYKEKVTTTYKEKVKDFYVCLKCKSGNSYIELDTDDNECNGLDNSLYGSDGKTYTFDNVGHEIYGRGSNVTLKYKDVIISEDGEDSSNTDDIIWINKVSPKIICDGNLCDNGVSTITVY